jgi:hypothetical protein
MSAETQSGTGWLCPVHGVVTETVVVPGSVSGPGCPICGRFVVQVEDTGSDPF